MNSLSREMLGNIDHNILCIAHLI